MLTLQTIATALPADESTAVHGPYASYLKKLGHHDTEYEGGGLLPYMSAPLAGARRLHKGGLSRKDALNVYKALKYCAEKAAKYMIPGDDAVEAALTPENMRLLRGYTSSIIDVVWGKGGDVVVSKGALEDDVPDVQVTDLSSSDDEDDEEGEGENNAGAFQNAAAAAATKQLQAQVRGLERKLASLREKTSMMERVLLEVAKALPRHEGVTEVLFRTAFEQFGI